MPRVPTLRANVSVNDVLVPPELAAVPANAAAASLNEQKQLAFRAAERAVSERRQRQYHEAVLELNRVNEEAQQQFADRNDFESFPAAHEQFLRNRYQSVYDNLDDERVRVAVEQKGEELFLSRSSAEHERARELESIAYDTAVTSGLQEFARRFENAKTTAERNLAFETGMEFLDNAVGSGRFNAKEAEALRSSFRRSAAYGYFYSIVDASPAQAAAEVMRDDHPYLSVLDLQERRELAGKARTAAAQVSASEKYAFQSELNAAITQATPDDVDDIESEIRNGLELGTLDLGSALAARGRLDKVVAAWEQRHQENISVLRRLDGDITAPVEGGKKTIDRFYEENIAGGLEAARESGDPYETAKAEASVAYYVKQTQRIPEHLRWQIRNGIQSENGKEMVKSLAMLEKLRAQPGGEPLVERAFNDRELLASQMFGTQIQGGRTPEEAAERVTQMLRIDSATMDARESAWVDEKMGEHVREHLTDEIGPRWWGLAGGEVHPPLAAHYVDAVRQRYLMGAPLDDAKESALRDVRSRWTRSTVGTGGNAVWRHRAPEVEYDVPGVDPSWLQEQLVADVSEHLGRAVDPDAIRLEVDPMTAVESEPKYTVFVTSEDGTPEAIVGMSWRPFFPTSEAAKRLEQAQAEAAAMTEEARAERAAMAESPKDYVQNLGSADPVVRGTAEAQLFYDDVGRYIDDIERARANSQAYVLDAMGRVGSAAGKIKPSLIEIAKDGRAYVVRRREAMREKEEAEQSEFEFATEKGRAFMEELIRGAVRE